jgi:hypothetical protein
MDDVTLSVLDHAGFRVRWSAGEAAYRLYSLPLRRRLSTSRTLLTAQHVIAELETWGFWSGGSPFFDQLHAVDDAVSSSVGDPFVVGDQASGMIGLATPDGVSVEPLPAPERGFAWTGHAGTDLEDTASAVLRASAPITCTPAPGQPLRPTVAACTVVFASDVLPTVAYRRPAMGLSIRAVQEWALTATDETTTSEEAGTAKLLATVDQIDDETLQRAVAELRPEAGSVSRHGPSRPRLRTVRAAGDEPGLTI